MKQNIILSIAQPCHENWNKMTALEKGRFCDSCQKKVFDFTSDSDRQILERIKNQENLCGRFLPSQLDRPLITPSKKYPRYLAATIGFLGLFSSGTTANAQSIKGDTVLVERKNLIVGKPASNPAIKGIVLANGKPLKNVKISIDGNIINTVTNKKGEFTLRCQKGSTLIFIHPDYEKCEVVIQNNQPVKIELKKKNEDKYILGGLGFAGFAPVNQSARKRFLQKLKGLFRNK
ncbi:carboxypeptidase-like regulatory domain-containing protein [Flavobacterium silvaticum]|uniref:Carboxypeptidase-like regulatory domain-containing protein n=1 Tax=Flavobacterium silvaticum TaxID=1852020 RepID=A0A972JH26_9FLAO|nr:carboxypeptidase-like regulatory domain-containing protein [Flavobacterium silvaticum]NMH28796.1 hypothetical protein [Flavobacterium silvaticum]